MSNCTDVRSLLIIVRCFLFDRLVIIIIHLSIYQHTLIPQLQTDVALCLAGRVNVTGVIYAGSSKCVSVASSYVAKPSDVACTLMYNKNCEIGDELTVAIAGQAKWLTVLKEVQASIDRAKPASSFFKVLQTPCKERQERMKNERSAIG